MNYVEKEICKVEESLDNDMFKLIDIKNSFYHNNIIQINSIIDTFNDRKIINIIKNSLKHNIYKLKEAQYNGNNINIEKNIISNLKLWINRFKLKNNPSIKSNYVDFQKARDVPISQVLSHYGIELTENKSEELCCCPLITHQDTTPSCSINIEKNLFHCFSCGKSGGTIELIKINENVSTFDASRILNEDF